MAKFNPFPEPKRGKARAVLERPAAMKTKKWNKTKYTRERSSVGPEGLRMDRTAWTRSLADLLTASDADVGGILLEDGLLVEARQDMLSMWPRPFVQSEGLPRPRCRAKRCHVYINPHHLHPWWWAARAQAPPFCMCHAVIHRLLNINHKTIEDMEKRLCHLHEEWVDAKEKSIDFGAGRPWADVDADETTFDRKGMES